MVPCPASDFCAAVDGATGNVVTFDGSTWTAPMNVDSKAAKSVSGQVLMFLMSVSCRSAAFCVAGDSRGKYSSKANGKAEFPRRCEWQRIAISRSVK